MTRSLKKTAKPHRSAKRGSSAAVQADRGSVGSSFEEFLREEGVYEATQAVALKRVIAWALAQEMRRQGVTKSAMAKRMNTSRSQLDRLLDPNNADVMLDTLARAADALDRRLKVELIAA
jgi:hypothetical protein